MKYDLTTYRHIRVMPCGGVIGAEIDGVEVGGTLDEGIFAEIRRAFNEHHVILFRDQKLDARSLAAFAERFAPLTIVTFTQGIPEHAMVTRLYRAADKTVSPRKPTATYLVIYELDVEDPVVVLREMRCRRQLGQMQTSDSPDRTSAQLTFYTPMS